MSTHPDPATYTPPPWPSPLTRLLWFCAGADGQLLLECPHSDRVKYQGLGGVVLATAVLAFLSGSYAFYTVFVPKQDTALASIQQSLDPATLVIAFIFGLVWASVIFNLDRFIVSSAGKGDGKESISWEELINASPRLLMAVAIAFTISKPLEIKIMESEIEAKLELEQQEYLSLLNKNSEELVEKKKIELIANLESIQGRFDERRAYFEDRRKEILDQRKLLEAEAEGLSASGIPGRGPAWQDKKDNLDRLEGELDRDRTADAQLRQPMEEELKSWKADLAALDAQLTEQRSINARQAHNLDGLIKRIEVAHELNMYVSVALTLLFIMIEVAPILFKLMLVKGPYDYLEENRKRLLCARSGIQIDGQVVVTPEGDGVEIRDEFYHGALAELNAELARIRCQHALTQKALEEYEQRTKNTIKEKLDDFVRTR